MISTAPLAGVLALAAQVQSAPLSAIPWLDSVMADREVLTTAPPQDTPITVIPISATRPIGILTPLQTGFPPNPWEGVSPLRVRRILAQLPETGVPEIHAAIRRLLLAEAPDPDISVTETRAATLFDRGHLDEADALLASAGITTPGLFQTWFDLSLLTGRADGPCTALLPQPELSPNRATTLYCLAQNGSWDAAWLGTALATSLDALPKTTGALLPFFLDPEWIDTAEPPRVANPSPLDIALLDSAGLPRPAAPLPLAFAHVDVQDIQPIRLRLHAAERLARHGAIAPATLFALYRRDVPAASGSVWDRAATVQAVDRDVTKLPALDAALSAVGLRQAAANALAASLSDLTPSDVPQEMHRLIALYRLLAGLEAAQWIGTSAEAEIKAAQALRAAPPPWPAAPAPSTFLPAFADALHTLAGPDRADHPGALAALVALGQTDTARAIAIELLLLEDR